MAHEQKPDFVFRRKGPVHLNRPEGASVQSTAGSRGVRISGSNAGYTMFRGSVKSTGYPLHSPPVSLSLPLPCATVYHHISTGVYRGGSTFIGYVTVNVLEMERKRLVANGVGSQYPSHYLGTWCIHHYYR